MAQRLFVLQNNVLVEKICPSARATDNTPLKQHADGTRHRYRSRRTYGTVHTRDGVEQISILSRQQWPERPISPWHRVSESSQLLPATGPRADRGRTNAGEAVVCIVVGARGPAPSMLASPGDREDERSPAARWTRRAAHVHSSGRHGATPSRTDHNLRRQRDMHPHVRNEAVDAAHAVS